MSCTQPVQMHCKKIIEKRIQFSGGPEEGGIAFAKDTGKLTAQGR